MNEAQGCRFGYPGKSANKVANPTATLTGLRLMMKLSLPNVAFGNVGLEVNNGFAVLRLKRSFNAVSSRLRRELIALFH
jgi:hypothetical protein